MGSRPSMVGRMLLQVGIGLLGWAVGRGMKRNLSCEDRIAFIGCIALAIFREMTQIETKQHIGFVQFTCVAFVGCG